MVAHLVRRLALAVLLLGTLSYSSFWVLTAHLNPLYPLLFQNPRPTEKINALTAASHLDASLPARYWLWIKGIVKGGAGARTILDQTPIWHPVWGAFERTLELAVAAMLVALVVGVAIGVIEAVRWDRPSDRALRAAGYLTWSTPAFVSAMVLQAVAVRFGHSTQTSILAPFGPPSGTGAGYLVSWFQHMTLPVIAVALGYVGLYSRYVRSGMLVTLNAPYTTVARAKGLAEWRVVLRHALRNALVPLFAVVSLDLSALIGTTLVADIVFGVQGIGSMFLSAIRLADPYQLESILTVTVAMVIVLTSLATSSTVGSIRASRSTEAIAPARRGQDRPRWTWRFASRPLGGRAEQSGGRSSSCSTVPTTSGGPRYCAC